ncbi:PilW family protein [Congregibacter litoralis]|uniref:Prepilin-type N-terminal cleavage/methylation domain protein n=1 Tax=Congregibacter litoralis KT71 TaxID=314285 RepID=A4ADT7_9GAMM|nr:PilW family protein [Congregibacter litoralis]EAQ95819.2 prepilin-type N-terminal cleavage/methylation domain protein [Congregibacter litoralis KT71]
MTLGNGTRWQQGFTLTELLVSLVLGLFVVGGVLSALLGGLESFRTTDSLSRMQESGRFALELLRRDIRQAGYTGCRSRLRAEVPRLTGSLSNNLIRNTLNPAPVGAVDALSFAFDFADPLMGYEATGSGTGSSWTAGVAGIPAATANPLLTNPRDDSDILVAVTPRGFGLGVPALFLGTDPIIVNTGNDLAVGNVVMVSDCTSAAITQITGIATAAGQDSLTHAIGLVTPGPNTGPGNHTVNLGRSFSVGAEVVPIERVAYYVADSAVTGRPALFRNGLEIAEDIEDLQVEYGVDTTGDTRINQYVTAAGMLVIATPGPAWENVLAVRVHLRISSGEENNLAEQPVTLNYAGTTFTADAADLRLHQVFTSTISIRNRLL